MQGQKGVIGSLPESLALEQGSSSSDSGPVEQQICWTDFMRHPPANTSQERQNRSMWTMGESSSSSMPTHMSQNRIDPKVEHGWSGLMKVYPEPQQHEPLASMLSLGDVSMNVTQNHANATNTRVVPHNVTVNPSTFIGMKPSSYASSSSDPLEMVNRPLARKRKAADLSNCQSSSGIESSNIFQRPSGSSSGWRLVSENPPSTNLMPSNPTIPGQGLDVGGISSDNHSENTRRNVRIRTNNSRQQDLFPATSVSNGQLNFLSHHSSLGLNPVDLRPQTVGISSSQGGQPISQVPVFRRNFQVTSRSRSSSLRGNRLSSLYDGGLGDNTGTPPTTISDHPLFVHPRDRRTGPQPAVNWSFNGNNGNSVVSTLNLVPAPTLPANMTPHRGSAHHSSRRLSEILRQSLVSSTDSGAGGVVDEGQSSNLFATLPPPVGPPQRAGVPSVIGIPGHHHRYHLAQQRTSDRQLDGAFRIPLLARAPGSEGRGRLSEIHSVMDLIRRREGLRFEDFMILDQSVLYRMADMHDRHRDMRLDIDNMSYEELLALEERMGNVSTGLTEENIVCCLKLKTYTSFAGQPDVEPCCICQEEYKNGDDLGSLKCGHDFHTSCIKQWLLQKNLCPVCKSAAHLSE
uniref:E3 ubiquitin-protein ligase MBR2-like n=1 Tax=Erigeron canadensis TaxID=72917 RepID=UPI001CB9B146|nr:E3 ubiquitin-protein ligase MBR2-like [Erigeron canadensis]